MDYKTSKTGGPVFTTENDGMRKSEFEFYKLEMDKKIRQMEFDRRVKQDCHARRILDLEDRVVFCGRLTVVALFLSAIAVVMSALF